MNYFNDELTPDQWINLEKIIAGEQSHAVSAEDVFKKYKTQEEIDAEPGVLKRGFMGGGVYGGASLLTGAAGLAADAVGADETANKLYTKSMDIAREGQEKYPDKVNFDAVLEDPSFSNIAEWLGYNAAATIPMMAGSMGVGSLASVGAKTFGKQMLKEIGENAIKNAATEEITKYGSEAIAKAAINKAVARIGTAGAAAGMSAPEAGGMWLNDVQKHGVEGSSPFTDMAMGGVSGSLEMLPFGVESSFIKAAFGEAGESAFKESLRKGEKEVAETMLGKALQRLNSGVKEGGTEFLGEGLQESGQELTSMVNEAIIAKPGEDVDLYNAKGAKRLLESGLVGGAVGFGPGTVLGAVRHNAEGLPVQESSQDNKTTVPPVETVTDIIPDIDKPVEASRQTQANNNPSNTLKTADQLTDILEPQESQYQDLSKGVNRWLPEYSPTSGDYQAQFPSDLGAGDARTSAGVFERQAQKTEQQKLADVLSGLAQAKQNAEIQAQEQAIVQSPIGADLLRQKLEQEQQAAQAPYIHEQVPQNPQGLWNVPSTEPVALPMVEPQIQEAPVVPVMPAQAPVFEAPVQPPVVELPQPVIQQKPSVISPGTRIEWNDKSGNTFAGKITGLKGNRYEIERENPRPGQGKKTFLHNNYAVRAVEKEDIRQPEKTTSSILQAEKPSFDVMINEAAKWKGAAANADKLYDAKDTRARLKHSQMTTKGDLDSFLMRKFGIDESEARSISNELTRNDIPADTSASVDDYTGEPWADEVLRKKPESNYNPVADKEPWEMDPAEFEYVRKKEGSDRVKVFSSSVDIASKSMGGSFDRLASVMARKVIGEKGNFGRLVSSGDGNNIAVKSKNGSTPKTTHLEKAAQLKANQTGNVAAMYEVADATDAVLGYVAATLPTSRHDASAIFDNGKISLTDDEYADPDSGVISKSEIAALGGRDIKFPLKVSAIQYFTPNKKIETEFDKAFSKYKKEDFKEHEDHVREAYGRGEPVPESVLKWYTGKAWYKNQPVADVEHGESQPITEETGFPKADSSKGLEGDRLIGKNKYGQEVYEDKNGVRSYIEGNIKVSEPVAIIPGFGKEINIGNQERFDKLRHGHLTNEEYEALKPQKPKLTEKTNELEKPSESTLERVQADDVQGTPEGGTTERSSDGSSHENTRRNERTGERGLSEPRSMGDGQGEVSVPSGRKEHGGGRRGESSVEAAQRDNKRDEQTDAGGGLRLTPENEKPAGVPEKTGDFSIAEDDGIGEGGSKTKFKNNISAIQTLKKIQDEGRPANKDEQKILAKYVGWGGIPQAFHKENGAVSTGWDKEAKILKETLSDEEYLAARRSTQDAHYTSPEIVKSIWAAVKKLGFKKGFVLEPSVGVGNFIGLMPKDIKSKTRVTGVELDTITGSITKLLYPSANIYPTTGFQDFVTPDNHFDLAIGNPPFGNIKLFDPKRKNLGNFSIHNYFFAKSIDSIRPGGILAMVVSNNLMDATNSEARKYISDKADLIAAWRLPNDAFLKNAGTEVTTDIIILQKREAGAEPNGIKWTDISSVKDHEGKADVPTNEYFAKHPENMFGKWGLYGTMYRPDMPALVSSEGQNTADLLSDAISRLPEGLFTNIEREPVKEKILSPGDIKGIKIDSMFMNNGKVFKRGADVLGEPTYIERQIEGKSLERVSGMIAIRDSFTRLRALQLSETATDEKIEAERKKLNTEYDSFVKKHGLILGDANKRLFREDPTWPQLSALEDGYDKGISRDIAKKTGEEPRAASAKKAAIFSKRTQYPYSKPVSAKSAKDALSISLSQKGDLDFEYMKSLYDKTDAEIASELKGLIFKTPSGEYQTREQYLNGNVKKKLKEAIEAAREDSSLSVNVEALESVQPADIDPVDINVKPGAHWIPVSDMKDFVSHISEAKETSAVYTHAAAKWIVKAKGVSPATDAKWGTSRIDTTDAINAALNQKYITVRDYDSDGTSKVNTEETALANEKVDLVKEAWREWIWSDDNRRDRLAKIYNDNFNTDNLVPHDGSHLDFPGKVGDDIIKLRPHQANAVWRIMQDGKALLDHVVGAGKTFTMIAAAMEMRRTGMSKKPVFVVPNHLVSQWAGDFIRLYPGANILAASKKDFEKTNRQRLFERITTGDWDAVVMAHSSFGKIAADPLFVNQFYSEQIADLEASIVKLREADGKDSRSVKQQEKMRDKLKEKIKKSMDDSTKDDVVNFGELGVDSLFVDEAHEFKNLAYFTSMQRVGGVSSGQGSNKASDLYVKVRQVMSMTDGKNVVFATGTPITNSMAEMYTLQKYLDYDNLKDQGLSHFDAWARMFGEAVTDWELSPAGKFQLKSRFSKFVNMPELLAKYRGFADVINRDDIIRQLKERGQTLPIPKIDGGKPENIVTERSPEQAAYIERLVYRSENLPKGKPQKGDDNMLVIMSDARKAALDMRLINPGAPDFSGSKVNTCARNIKSIYDKWNKDKGTQLVFCDLSTPKKAQAAAKAEYNALIELAEAGDDKAIDALDKMSPDEIDALNSEFSVYDDLKAKLIKAGIPEKEIAFIHDANTDIQKEELFSKVRSGRVRVMLGSSSKMGAGMNVQDRLVALHHLDAPWRPSDLEQREGRIIRQGNKLYEVDPENFSVNIMRYATEQTLDSRMWQVIETKARFIEQVRKGDLESREIEDLGGEAANAAEMKAASSGNPLILEENDLRTKIKKLEDSRKGFDRAQHSLKNNIRQTKDRISFLEEKLADLEKDKESLPEFSKDFKLGGNKIGKRTEAGAALISEIVSFMKGDMDTKTLGSFGKFSIEIEAVKETFDFTPYIVISGAGSYSVKVSTMEDQDAVGLITRIENAVKRIPETYNEALSSLNDYKKDLPKLEAQVQPWNKTEELSKLKSRHREVIDELKPKKEEGKEGQTENTSTQNTKKSQSLGVKINSFQDFTNLLVLTGGKGSLSTSDGIVTINQKAMGVAEIKIRGSEDAVGKYLEDGELLRLAGKDPSTEKKDVQLVMSNHRASRAFDYISKKDFFVTDNFHDQARLMLGMVTPEAVVSKVSEPSASFVNKGFPVYSLADKKEPAGIPADLISKEFSRLASRLPHEVVKSEKELPQGIREDISEKGFSGRAQALFDPESGKVFFVADNIGSIQAAQTGFLENLFRHEGRHAAISQMFESKGARNMFMDRAARAFKSDVESYLKKNGLENSKENVRMAAEEALVDQTVKGGVHALLDEFASKVMRWARKIFSGLGMTMAEARDFIRRADSMIESGFSGKSDGKGVLESPKFKLSDKVINKQIYTDAFKKWFGRSTVVEKDGRPMVVYKGMPTYDWRDGSSINIINSPNGKWAGFFTDSPSVANRFAEAFSFTNKQGVYPVYLKIENPFVIDAGGEKASAFQFDRPSGNGNNQELLNAINSNKYDGIIIKNTSDEGSIFVPMNPEQVKSAIGNTGSFDSSNPDIRYSLKDRTTSLSELGIKTEYSDIKSTDKDGNETTTRQLVINGPFKDQYKKLMPIIGGEYKYQKTPGARGVTTRNTYVFKNPSENIEQQIVKIIRAFHDLDNLGLVARFREKEDGSTTLFVDGNNLHMLADTMKRIGGKLVKPQEAGKKPFFVFPNPEASTPNEIVSQAKAFNDTLGKMVITNRDKGSAMLNEFVSPADESLSAKGKRIIDDVRSLFQKSDIVLPSNNTDIAKGLHWVQTETDMAKNNPEFKKVYDVNEKYEAIATQWTAQDRELTTPYYDLDQKNREPVDKALIAEDEARKEFSEDELKKRFSLTDDQLKAHQAMRGLYKKKLRDVVSDMLKQSFRDLYFDDAFVSQVVEAGSREDVQNLLKEHGVDSKKADKLSWLFDWVNERKGYIPHKWDSEWLVRINMPDGDTYLLDVPTITGNILPTKALREGAANKAAVRVIKERIGWDDDQIKEWIDSGNILLVKNKELPVDLFHGASMHVMTAIIDSATEQAWEEQKDSFSSEQLMKQADLKAEIRKQMEELFLAKGAGKHFIARKGTRGFRTDIGNITGEYIGGFNHFMVKRDKAMEFAKAMKDIDPKKTPELFKHTRAFIDDMLGESQEVPWFKRLVGTWFLGLDVSAAALNGTQNFTHAAPLMMRIKGKESSHMQLVAAMKDAFNEWRDAKKAGRKIFTGESKFITKKEGEIVRDLYEQGFFDPAVVGEQTGFHPTKLWDNYADKVTRFMMGMFTGIEALNRSSTFLAAYRRAVKAGEADAINIAKQIVMDAHYAGGKKNRPLLVRRMGAIGNIGYTFMVFPVNNLFFLKDMCKAAIEAYGGKGDLKTELKAIGAHLGALFTLGGLAALPFANILAPLAKGIFSDDDDDWEVALRKHLHPEVGRWLVRGVPALLGNDMSGRVSSDVIGMPAGFGVINTMYKRALKAGDYAVQGDYLDSVMALSPDFMRNPYNAVMGMTEGGEKKGRSPVKYNSWQAFNKALGFSPTAETEAYATKQSLDNVKAKKLDKREYFAEELLQLQKKKDSISIGKLRKELNEYNELQKKDDDPVIKWSSVIKSARQREKMRNKGYMDRIPKNMKSQKVAALTALGEGD